jgi:hypothetical protein
MRVSGIVGEPPGKGRVWLVSKAWIVFFALSLKRSVDCAFRVASATGSISRAWRVQSAAEFVALIGAPRVLPLHSGSRPVRRLRCSITIATFPGRNARAVRRFNLFAPASERWIGGAALIVGHYSRRSRRCVAS